MFPIAMAQEIPKTDCRLTDIRHLDLAYRLAEYPTKEAWLVRAASLRKQILVSAGLWPTPPKPPIQATIFGKLDRGDYTIEKVYFESHPGFYVTGGLYRPKDAAGKKVPAVLCPHGHWTYGRLENQQLNSGPARAANFARQGYVAFAYDMVGYNDSAAISHRFASGHRTNAIDRETLWGVNLLGLQLWDSIRSVDFLLTLPEVDPERIACTGESGGGTQTFLLAAVDDRIQVAAPVNMISFLMQGGCLCENAPNLRVDTNNVEIGALMAPRPMLMVSATGDWTKNTLTSEYPAIRGFYRLLGAEDKVTAVQMDAPHNYNQDSREAVYGWFAHWLLGRSDTIPVKERSGDVSSVTDLLVFYGKQRPENELNEIQLSASLIEMRRKQLEEAQPRAASGLERFREQFGTALRYSLMAEYPDPAGIITGEVRTGSPNGLTREDSVISRRGREDRVAITSYKSAAKTTDHSYVLLITPDTLHNSTGGMENLVGSLTRSGHTVILVHCFPGGRRIPDKIEFFTTYNRTDEANRVQDILTAIAYVKGRDGNARISVVAQGQAGLWALLARGLAPKIDKMMIDAAGFDTGSDADYLKLLPIPGIRRAGDFMTAVAVSPLAPLFVHNTMAKFRTERMAAFYQQFGRAEDFKTQSAALNDAALTAWLSSK
jgi:dienelactone hydrolase